MKPLLYNAFIAAAMQSLQLHCFHSLRHAVTANENELMASAMQSMHLQCICCLCLAITANTLLLLLCSAIKVTFLPGSAANYICQPFSFPCNAMYVPVHSFIV